MNLKALVDWEGLVAVEWVSKRYGLHMMIVFFSLTSLFIQEDLVIMMGMGVVGKEAVILLSVGVGVEEAGVVAQGESPS